MGHEFDINKDGLYDARSGAVNFWCSPEDKPTCWNAEIIPGSLNYPRAYVGSVSWDWQDDLTQAELFLEASPYDLKKNPTEKEWESVFEWLEKQFKGLMRLVGMHEDVYGTRCPFCDFVLGKEYMLNGLIEHIHEIHQKQVQSVILATPTTLEIEGNEYPLETKSDIRE